MKRGGLAIAAILVVTGVLRWVSPGGGSNLGAGQDSAAIKPAAEESSDKRPQNQSTNSPHGPYASELEDTIQAYFGVPQEIPASLTTVKKPSDPRQLIDTLLHWNVPERERRGLRFLIALLADPVHTQLGLPFDREIEAIQQAAQEQNYDFDRATMPWDSSEHRESTDFSKREQEAAEKAEREAFPGLMIFRPSVEPTNAGQTSTLFVFVVGESPTGGVNKKQFARALDIICAIKDDCKQSEDPKTKSSSLNASAILLAKPAAPPEPLMILGPSASGSLYSLQKNLDLNRKLIGNRRVYVFSGTQRASAPRSWFQLNKSQNVRFVPFQDGENRVIDHFVQFAASRGYDPGDIAVLSEDETAYGRAVSPPPRLPSHLKEEAGSSCSDYENQQASSRSNTQAGVTILFPRGISQFRAAYQKQIAQTGQPQGSSDALHPILPLDLAANGSNDDSVASYATTQSPLSQEAVMLGIVSRLHQCRPKFVILRASDPVDELFLLRYLRQSFPQGRVVVTAPDLLYAREDDGLLHGVLAISAYPLVAGTDRYLTLPAGAQLPRSHHIFPSSSETGVYNAVVALLAIEQNSSLGDSLFVNDPQRGLHDLPAAPYSGYGAFRDWRLAQPCQSVQAVSEGCNDEALAPGLSISILGRDGYWLADAPPRDESSDLHQINAVAGAISSGVGPRTPTIWTFAYSVTLFVLLLHLYLIRTGNVLSGSEIRARFAVVEEPSWRRPRKPSSEKDSRDEILSHRKLRARLLAYGTAALASIALLLVGARYALVERQEGKLVTLFFVLIPVAFTFAVSWSLHKQRGEPEVAWVLFGGIAFLGLDTFLPLTGPTSLITSLTAYRDIHLASGVSPLLPILFLIAALYCMVWFELHALAITDCRHPQMPHRDQLSNDFYRVSEEDVTLLRYYAKSFSVPWRVFMPILCFLAPIVLLTIDFHHPHPVQTIEGKAYDTLYAGLLLLWLCLFMGCLSRFVVVWNECRRILGGLDALPLRDAFKNLKDFTWNLVWSPAGSALRDSFKFVSREIENLRHLQKALHLTDVYSRSDIQLRWLAEVDVEIKATFKLLGVAQQHYHESAEAPKAGADSGKRSSEELGAPETPRDGFTSQAAAMMDSFANLQHQLGKMAGVVLMKLLVPSWGKVVSPVASEVPPDIVEKKSACQLVAEEFVALVYANFLASVLLRLRSLVMEAICIYVCLLLSISCYPFEPNPAMFTLAVILILVMGVVIGYVYSQMHRDPTLSRLTSTPEGERGLDFWLQFLGAGAVPVLSLLAVQFPTISHFLMSWLQPALQASK